MKNRKGFTLIELLVAITIIGIIMLMVLPAITNLQRENQKKKFDDYERAVLEAAKAYEDQYEEDLFGRYSEGCAYIDYESLIEKKLLTTTTISGYECRHDTNGIIIRKVNGKSFYEVYLDCIKNGETKKLTGNSDYDTVKREQCNVGEDKELPELEIKCDGETTPGGEFITGIDGDDGEKYYRGFEREQPVILPKLTVKVSDKNSGLEKNQHVSYEWRIYTNAKDQDENIPNYTEKNKTTFNIKDGAGSTAEKSVRIIESLKQENETGKAIINLSGENIVDRAGNKLEGVKKECIYYYDNTPPQMEIRITGNDTGKEYTIDSNSWINEPITTTVIVTDKTDNNIYSGIDMESFENSNIKDATLSGKDETTATHTYTLVDTNRNKNDVYKICDKVGNCTTKTVRIKVDTTYPTCKSRGGDIYWRNNPLTIYGDCVDQGDSKDYSGCRRDEYFKEYSADQSINNATAGEACDNAGNCVMCSEDQEVHIDRIKPDCGFIDIYNEDAAGVLPTATVQCNDNMGLYQCDDTINGKVPANSNPDKEIKRMIPGKKGEIVVKVVDQAGNTGQCSITFREMKCTSNCCGTHNCNRHCTSWACYSTDGVMLYVCSTKESCGCAYSNSGYVGCYKYGYDQCPNTCTSGECCGYRAK